MVRVVLGRVPSIDRHHVEEAQFWLCLEPLYNIQWVSQTLQRHRSRCSDVFIRVQQCGARSSMAASLSEHGRPLWANHRGLVSGDGWMGSVEGGG